MPLNLNQDGEGLVREMRDLLKRDAFQFWARILDMAATIKEAGRPGLTP